MPLSPIDDSWERGIGTTEASKGQAALYVTPGTQIVRLVISGALASTETGTAGANIIAVLAPDDGSAGPLGRPASNQKPAPESSDEAKQTD